MVAGAKGQAMMASKQSAVERPQSWQVVVHGVGYIGQVTESRESLARCAALSRYGAEGERQGTMRGLILEDDTSYVSPAH